MNILEQKQAVAGTSRPTDRVLWNTCAIIRDPISGFFFKQTIQGTFQRSMSTKLGKSAIKRAKRRTHNRRHYFETRNSIRNAETN